VTVFLSGGAGSMGIIVCLLFYGIALVYKFAPSVKKRWKLLSVGSVLATFLTLITTIVFSYWVNNFASYNKVYGSIGTVMILMISSISIR
jgi:membrane protein